MAPSLAACGEHVVQGDRLGGVRRHPDRLDAGRRERGGRRHHRDRGPHLVGARVGEHERALAGALGQTEQQVGGGRLGLRRQPVLAGRAGTRAGRRSRRRAPRAGPGWCAPRARARRGSARSGRGRAARLLLPGTETPRSAGTSTTPLGERTVMSAMAGPAFGLTSSSTESWVGVRADPGEPLVGHRGRAVDRGQRRRLRAPGDQAGREVAGAGDHRRTESLRCRGDAAGAHRAAVPPTSRARPARRPTPSRPDLRRGCSRRAGRTRCRAGRRGRSPTRRSAGSRRVPSPSGSARSGCRSSSASTATTGSTIARSTSAPQPAPHRRPPSRSRSVERRTQDEDDQDREPLQDQQPDPQPRPRPVEVARREGPADLPGAGARGPRRWPAPARRSRRAPPPPRRRRVPAARRTRCRARPAPPRRPGSAGTPAPAPGP